MKKIWRLLAAGLVSSGVVVSGVTTVGGRCGYSSEDAIQEAIGYFSNKDHALKIPFVVSNSDVNFSESYEKSVVNLAAKGQNNKIKKSASDPSVAKALREAMRKQDETCKITEQVSQKIIFGGEITEGEEVSITARYEGKSIPIYVREEVQTKKGKVMQALEKFNSGETPVRLQFIKDSVEARDLKVSHAIRTALQDSRLTEDIARDITFGDEIIKEGETVSVTAKYKGESKSIYVWEAVNIKDALKKFTNSNPLEINWNQAHKGRDPITKTSEPKVSEQGITRLLRTELVIKDETQKINDEVAQDITFNGDEELIPGKSVEVMAEYEWKDQPVPVFVRETKIPDDVLVMRALAQFDDAQHPLTVEWVSDEILACELKATKALREALIEQDATQKINDEVAQDINFGCETVRRGKTALVKVTYKSWTRQIYVREGETPDDVLVMRALAQFDTKNPLAVKWFDRTPKVSDSQVSEELKKALRKQDKTGRITYQVTLGITFGDEVLQPKEAVAVTVTYKDKPPVQIYVKEDKTPDDVLVMRALAQFDDAQHPLTVEWVGKNPKASEPEVTEALRKALIEQDTTHKINGKVVQDITFGDETVQRGEQPVSITVKYKGKITSIYVKEDPSLKAVEEALRQFNKRNPLSIKFLIKHGDRRRADDKGVTDALRNALKEKDSSIPKVLTPYVVSRITFSGTVIRWRFSDITAKFSELKVIIRVFDLSVK